MLQLLNLPLWRVAYGFRVCGTFLSFQSIIMQYKISHETNKLKNRQRLKYIKYHQLKSESSLPNASVDTSSTFTDKSPLNFSVNSYS